MRCFLALFPYATQVVRIGHPARLEPAVLEYSLDALVANSDSARIILDVRQDIDKAYVCTGIYVYVHMHRTSCIDSISQNNDTECFYRTIPNVCCMHLLSSVYVLELWCKEYSFVSIPQTH